jgi:hypothetical protein
MDRAFRCYFHELRMLLRRYRAGQLHIEVDPVEHAGLGFAFFTIFRVDARVPQRNGDILQRNFLAPRRPADGHGSASPKGGEQVVVGVGRRLGAADADRFVDKEGVFPGSGFLEKTARAAADNHVLYGVLIGTVGPAVEVLMRRLYRVR